MFTALPHLKTFLAFRINGDMGGLTWYTTRRGRIVAYPASPATKPPTPEQVICRARFAAAMTAWRSLTPAQRSDYRRACDLLSLCMLGHNVYVHLSLRGNVTLWQTLRDQTGLDLAAPAVV